MFKKIWNFLTKSAYPPKKYVVLVADDGTEIFIEASSTLTVFIHKTSMDSPFCLSRAKEQESDPQSYILQHQFFGLGERSK